MVSGEASLALASIMGTIPERGHGLAETVAVAACNHKRYPRNT